MTIKMRKLHLFKAHTQFFHMFLVSYYPTDMIHPHPMKATGSFGLTSQAPQAEHTSSTAMARTPKHQIKASKMGPLPPQLWPFEWGNEVLNHQI
jgi:hypothetical protein